MVMAPIRDPRIQTEIREFLKLAVPLASAQVAQSATGFADTIMMGRMGADVLAGGGLASIIYMSIMVTTSSMVMGVSPLIAEAFGAGQQTRIQQIARQGLWLSVLVTIPMMIVTGHLDRWMIHTGQTETTVQLANTYLDIMMWGLFPAVGFAALRATVSALSHARPIMIIVIAGTAFNVVWNYILGFGKFGFPQMGLAGLALASVLALWGMFLSLALYILLHPKLRNYRVFHNLHQVRPKILRELAWVGVPIGVFAGLETGFFMVIMLWMGTLGIAALAAHQIVLQTLTVIFMIPLGISFATTVRVGQWLGRKDILGIQQAAGVSLSLTTIVMLGMSIVFLVFPKQVIGIYLDVQNPNNAEIVSLAMPLLMIAAIVQVLDGLQKAVYGCLQGLQDTRIPMFLNVLGFWGVGLSTGYLLSFHFGMGSRGLWIGQSIAIAVVAVLFTGRFLRLIAQRKALNPGN
ncbi:multi-drug efflux transporter [Leptolyngbya sp. NIES-3755]|nr:multi-drug efflux transporter [Leptolyngbya sp. NIES-3755]